jgi:hypothetical protein
MKKKKYLKTYLKRYKNKLLDIKVTKCPYFIKYILLKMNLLAGKKSKKC